jgi:hypothetical protein
MYATAFATSAAYSIGWYCTVAPYGRVGESANAEAQRTINATRLRTNCATRRMQITIGAKVSISTFTTR